MLSIADCVQKWGNATSVAFFNPACRFFQQTDTPGVIGFRQTKHHAVIFGDPACPQESLLPLSQAFHNYMAQKHLAAIYIGTSTPFTQLLLQQDLCASAIGIGHEIILPTAQQHDPRAQSGADGSSLRNKWRFSTRRGITVQEYIGHDPALEQQLLQVQAAWLASRQGLQIYLSPADIFAHRSAKRWFYAMHNEMVVGIALLNRLDATNAYVLNLLMLSPEAPSTTSEFLIMSLLEQLRSEQAAHLSAGMVPLPSLGAIHGWSNYCTWMARHIYACWQRIGKLQRKERYWRKFAPHKNDLFLAFSRNRLGFSEFISIMQTLHIIGA